MCWNSFGGKSAEKLPRLTRVSQLIGVDERGVQGRTPRSFQRSAASCSQMQVQRSPCESSRLAAAAPAAIHLRPRFVHAQWLAMKIFAVERRDGSQRMGLARHLDEA